MKEIDITEGFRKLFSKATAADHKSATQTQQSDVLAFGILYFQNKTNVPVPTRIIKIYEETPNRGDRRG